jgi:hypothetical protein
MTIDTPVTGPIIRPCDECHHPHGLIAENENDKVRCIDCGVKHNNAQSSKDWFFLADQKLGLIQRVEHIYPGVIRFSLSDIDVPYWRERLQQQAQETLNQAIEQRGN